MRAMMASRISSVRCESRTAAQEFLGGEFMKVTRASTSDAQTPSAKLEVRAMSRSCSLRRSS